MGCKSEVWPAGAFYRIRDHNHMNDMDGEAFTKLQAAVILAAIVSAAIIGISAWCFIEYEGKPSFELRENAVGVSIVVEAEEGILHFQEELLWSENQFSEIMENQNEFSSHLIEEFNTNLLIYGERDEYAVDPYVESNETKKSTILKCDLHGAISKSEDRYHATFKWVLGPLGLDFIDDDFEESTKGLSWEDMVNGIPTTVSIELPPRDCVYAAWHHPNGHCHAHAWWETEEKPDPNHTLTSWKIYVAWTVL